MRKKLSLWEKIKRFFGGFGILFSEVECTYNERCKRRLEEGVDIATTFENFQEFFWMSKFKRGLCETSQSPQILFAS